MADARCRGHRFPLAAGACPQCRHRRKQRWPDRYNSDPIHSDLIISDRIRPALYQPECRPARRGRRRIRPAARPGRPAFQDPFFEARSPKTL